MRVSARPEASPQTPVDPAAVVREQENHSAELAAQWLGGDPRTRAWGAYLALRDRRRERLPQLAALAGTAPFASDPDHNAMLQVLDAIIQMDGKVSPEVAAKLYPEFPVPAFILLSRAGPSASSVLLDIFNAEAARQPAPSGSKGLVADGLAEGAQDVDAWLTAGNLLMPLRPSGFAAAILRGFKINLQVRVVDANSNLTEKPGGLGASCAGGVPNPTGSWPAVGNYAFAEPGNLWLSSGIDPSFYKRTVGAAMRRELPCGWRTSRNLADEHFLAALAGERPEAATVQTSVHRQVVWKTNPEYLDELRRLIGLQQSAIDSLAINLEHAGLLTPNERQTVRPTLQVWISDARADKSILLAKLQSSAPNVTIVGE